MVYGPSLFSHPICESKQFLKKVCRDLEENAYFQDLAGGAHGIVERIGLICNFTLFQCVSIYFLNFQKKSKITTGLRFTAQIYIVVFIQFARGELNPYQGARKG